MPWGHQEKPRSISRTSPGQIQLRTGRWRPGKTPLTTRPSGSGSSLPTTSSPSLKLASKQVCGRIAKSGDDRWVHVRFRTKAGQVELGELEHFCEAAKIWVESRRLDLETEQFFKPSSKVLGQFGIKVKAVTPGDDRTHFFLVSFLLPAMHRLLPSRPYTTFPYQSHPVNLQDVSLILCIH